MKVVDTVTVHEDVGTHEPVIRTWTLFLMDDGSVRWLPFEEES